ncbi:MAG: hypothetical protein ACYTGZ_15705 [Planctomycetota bacterium]|jgi:hypothetical protein
MFRMRRDKAGLAKGDLLMVVPAAVSGGAVPGGAVPEGGEFVIDLEGRVCRHDASLGGGPVMGVIVGVVRDRK